eukprot:TRINITY_DN998_c0_g1_i1.p9 TRINITY_DN998_c0_g1~~TRINITY_DN998_c0_g1_i1.p9  ORF type:complete len:100 (+),score=4.74 TRINITY_DN998_c0_g1_i1:496-795(+)
MSQYDSIWVWRDHELIINTIKNKKQKMSQPIEIKVTNSLELNVLFNSRSQPRQNSKVVKYLVVFQPCHLHGPRLPKPEILAYVGSVDYLTLLPLQGEAI